QYYTGPTPFQYPQPAGNQHPTFTHVWVYQPPSNSPYMMLTEIDMPGNMSYTFSYNGYGELIQINYPTGGYTKYGYEALQHGEVLWDAGIANTSSDFREVTSKRVCRDPSGACSPSAEDVTTYEPTISDARSLNNDSVVVKHFLDEASNIFEKTTYEFTNDTTLDNTPQYYSPRETKRSIYAANGTLLRTIQTSYIENADLPGYKSLPSSVTTTLYDVSPPLVTKTDTQYDTYSATVRWPRADGDATTYQMQTIQARTRFIDNPLTQTAYDFGQNASGAALRITNSTWWKAQWANHIWNRPLTQEVQDGMATRLAYTSFEYDSYTEGITASGATQLRGCTGSACTQRGNQTAVSHWRKSDGAMLTTRSQFDDAGNVRKVTDPLGHSTTFSFADNWTGGDSTCAPAAGAAAA